MTGYSRWPLFVMAPLLLVSLLWGCEDSSQDGYGSQTPEVDGDEADGDKSDGDTVEDLPAKIEGTMLRFDNGASSSDLFAFPFPSNLRLKETKGVNMLGFPNPQGMDILQGYLDVAENELDGFGNNSPIYFAFDAPLDPASLPQDRFHTPFWDSPLLLVDIDPNSPEYGRLIPLRYHYNETETSYQAANLLALAPVWGFPLRGATTYAAIVTDAVTDAQGQAIGRPEALGQALYDEESFEMFGPLKTFLEQTDFLHKNQVRAATVFTTGDPTAELKAIHDWLWSDAFTPGAVGDITYVNVSGAYDHYVGTYESPNFQRGEVPYATEGGGIEFDENGEPIIVRTETLRFVLAIPRDQDMPEDGWPITMQAHGTGGNYTSHFGPSESEPAQQLARVGVASIGIDQPLHGTRGNEDTNVEMHSFNYLNPEAGRSNFRQSALDTVVLTRMLYEGRFVIPATVSQTGEEIRFNPQNLFFAGHSHGGMTGALAAAVEDKVKGWVLSSMGGGMAMTILQRKDPFDIIELLKVLLGAGTDEEIHDLHPIVGLVQMLVEITDMINYTPRFVDIPFDGKARNMLCINGMGDPYTPMDTSEAAITAARIPYLKPTYRPIWGLELLGISPEEPPVSRNIVGPDGNTVTAGAAMFPFYGHFPFFDDTRARLWYSGFVRSLAYDEVPSLGEGE